MFEKITKTLSGLAFIKYINSLIDYVNTSDIDATRIKGQLDISNIPPAGLDNVIKVDTVTDMLALTVDDVQNGDTVMIIGVTPPVQYQVVDDTKLGTMDAFQEYAAGTATKALADINGNNIHTTYGKLAGNNTWTGNNYWNVGAMFNANLTIRGSATTPGDVSTYLWLGTQPEGSEQTPSIVRNKIGDLIMYAADYRHCYLRSGIQTSFASVYNSDGTVEFSSLNNTPWGKYTNANGLELTVNKTPTANTDVSNKKYVDDSIASAGSGFNLTTYTSLEQLGITPGQETFASIHSALPINSVLEYYVSEAQNFADIYPASYGNFIATRLTEDITIFHFTGTNQIIYVTHYHVTANTNPSWAQIAKQSDLTNLSNSVVKSVNGVKPTNGDVTIDALKPVIASEAEAEAGTDNTKFMTPLRVAQAIDSLDGNPITGASISDKTITLTKKDGSTITLNTQDTNTSNWSISEGANGWARENVTGFTIQWGTKTTFPRTFTTAFQVVMQANNNKGEQLYKDQVTVTRISNNGFTIGSPGQGQRYVAFGIS